jgi:hypothetical protein
MRVWQGLGRVPVYLEIVCATIQFLCAQVSCLYIKCAQVSDYHYYAGFTAPGSEETSKQGSNEKLSPGYERVHLFIIGRIY